MYEQSRNCYIKSGLLKSLIIFYKETFFCKIEQFHQKKIYSYQKLLLLLAAQKKNSYF
jgi:hypothetical protein